MKKIKEWWYYKTPTAGNKGFLVNLAYKLAWRFCGVVSPSCGTYKQFKNSNNQIREEKERLRKVIRQLEEENK